MTPEQKIKMTILCHASKHGDFVFPINSVNNVDVNESNIDQIFSDFDSEDGVGYKNDFRGSGIETNLATPYSPASRNYESEEVAAQMYDGSWVGWTYWHGGGKHSDPDSIEWMEFAYDLNCVEQEQTVIVREFTKVGE